MRRGWLFLCGLALACGGGDNGGGTPPGPSPNPPNANTITITASGANPRQLTVTPGSRVLFRNQDSRQHEMSSDDHPDHLECPDLNVGILNPGQERESRNLVTVRTCGFHDHLNPDTTTLTGRIIIQ